MYLSYLHSNLFLLSLKLAVLDLFTVTHWVMVKFLFHKIYPEFVLPWYVSCSTFSSFDSVVDVRRAATRLSYLGRLILISSILAIIPLAMTLGVNMCWWNFPLILTVLGGETFAYIYKMLPMYLLFFCPFIVFIFLLICDTAHRIYSAGTDVSRRYSVIIRVASFSVGCAFFVNVLTTPL